MRTIFVNFSVQNIATTRAFWTELGFSFSAEYSDDHALCLILEENILAMLMTDARFGESINGEIADPHSSTEVLTCLTVPTYGGSFQDPDGHVCELMAQDPATPSGAPTGSPAVALPTARSGGATGTLVLRADSAQEQQRRDRCGAAAPGALLDHCPPDTACPQSDHHDRPRYLDEDQVHQRDPGRGSSKLDQ